MADINDGPPQGVGLYDHANGTVRMGPVSDPQAVVDAADAVRAVAGLSVIDASMMPTPPSDVPAPTVMALAEKLSRDLCPSNCRQST